MAGGGDGVSSNIDPFASHRWPFIACAQVLAAYGQVVAVVLRLCDRDVSILEHLNRSDFRLHLLGFSTAALLTAGGQEQNVSGTPSEQDEAWAEDLRSFCASASSKIATAETEMGRSASYWLVAEKCRAELKRCRAWIGLQNMY